MKNEMRENEINVGVHCFELNHIKLKNTSLFPYELAVISWFLNYFTETLKMQHHYGFVDFFFFSIKKKQITFIFYNLHRLIKCNNHQQMIVTATLALGEIMSKRSGFILFKLNVIFE